MNKYLNVLLLCETVLLGGCHALMTINSVSTDISMSESFDWSGKYAARIESQEYRMDIRKDVQKGCYLIDAGTNGNFKANISKWDSDSFWVSFTVSDEAGRRILRTAKGYEACFLIPVHCNVVLRKDNSGYGIWLIKRCEEVSGGGMVSDLPMDEIMKQYKNVNLKKIGELIRETGGDE